MKKPMLQIALDNLSLNDAFNALAPVADAIDIIEVGTILLCAEGTKAVSEIKKRYPNKIVLADAKIADAGEIISNMLFNANADIITAICCADISTITKMHQAALKRNKEIQIELTGYWSWEQAQAWRNAGVPQVVYHRSRDAELAGKGWSEEDITKIKRLAEMGFKVTITGGINLNNLPLFQGIPIYIVIAGRAIRENSNPLQAANDLTTAIAKIWG